jgi:hypothetical protein
MNHAGIAAVSRKWTSAFGQERTFHYVFEIPTLTYINMVCSIPA